MIPYNDAIAQFKEWKNKSTPLFMHWSLGCASGWCNGVLKLAGSSELHFGIETIDGKDFLFVINVHLAYNPRFRVVDNRESFQFFAPQRDLTQFGKVLEISLRGNRGEEERGRVILAEVFPKVIEV